MRYRHPMGFGETSFLEPSIQDFDDPDNVIFNGMRISRYNASTEDMVYLGGHAVNVQRYLANKGYDDLTQFYGLHHDSAEALIGDWIRPLKQVPVLRDIIEEKESQIRESIWDYYGIPSPDGAWEAVTDADDRVLLWEMDQTWRDPARTENMEELYADNDWDASPDEIIEEVGRDSRLDYTPSGARDAFIEAHESLIS